MVYYTEDGKRVKFDLKEENVIGRGGQSKVYKISEEKCLKKLFGFGNYEILKLIRDLKLPSYYIIYDLLFNKRSILKAYIIEYYVSEEIDILTMPVDYTLYNFFSILDSVMVLTENNVYVSDLHEDNVIMNSNGITVIDTDLYTKNRFFYADELLSKNVSAVRCLFKNLYFSSLNDYHDGEIKESISPKVNDLFNINNVGDAYNTVKKLSKYKYPIDYMKR